VKTKLVLGFVLFFYWSAPVFGADRPLRVTFASPATIFLPLWMAKEAKIFERNGINAELIYLGSSPLALSALLAGDIDISGSGATVAPSAYLRGLRDLALFASISNRFVFAIYSHAAIPNAAALRGKRVGITRFGGVNDFATRYFLRQSGLEPRKDVTLVQVGRSEDILGAMAAGSIDAGSLTFPQDLQAKKLGFRELADLSQSDARYVGASFMARRAFLTEARPRMESFTRSLIQALAYTKTHRTESLQVLSRYMRVSDPEILNRSYEHHVKLIWPKTPEIDPNGFKLVFEHLAETDPRVWNINPADLIDNTLVRDVVKAGVPEHSP
jgi:NitT/TauT family transport system substrate-binding protein